MTRWRILPPFLAIFGGFFLRWRKEFFGGFFIIFGGLAENRKKSKYLLKIALNIKYFNLFHARMIIFDKIRLLDQRPIMIVHGVVVNRILELSFD